MRYIGSKRWCLERLFRLVQRELPSATSICDPFAGTCTIPRYFKSRGFKVVTGDMLRLSYAFQVASIQLNRPPRFTRLSQYLNLNHGNRNAFGVLRVLNSLQGRHGWLTNNFSLAGTERRKFFTVANARRIDAVRLTIRRWQEQGHISSEEKWYLLACLLDEVDRVANTAGTYYAYLRSFYRKAKRPLLLRPVAMFDNGKRNAVHCSDAQEVVNNSQADVLYLDPPYNERDYGAYYHLPELLATDTPTQVVGISGRPQRRLIARSRFCSRASAADALSGVLKAAQAKLIILHYSTKGLVKH